MQNLRHYIVMAVLIAVVSVLTYLGLDSLGLMPVPAAAQAGYIDWLMDLQVKLIAFFFALIVVPMAYSLIVFRRKPGETGDGEHIEGNTSLEVTWTFIPLVIVIVLGYIGADNLAQVKRVDPQALEIKVVGYQWGWRFEYPEGFVSNTLYLPVDKQVVLKMESNDVLHSFWVPEFRVKHDLVPGRIEDYRITPTMIGDYKVRCAEICGSSHAYMESPIKVLAQADYTAWVNEQAAIAAAEAEAALANPDPKRGEKLYNEAGCKACHSLDGSKGVGPSWKGLWGSQVPLADGTTVVGDEAYITESIRNPSAKVHQGFSPNAMPNFSYLKDGQIADLIEFIKTLK
ncbi:MAG: cytochrome c oxidase subunit II [Anaerolineales bacterium]